MCWKQRDEVQKHRNTEFQDCVGRWWRELSIDVLTRMVTVLGCWWVQLPAEQSRFWHQSSGNDLKRKPSHVAFFLVRRRQPGIHTSEWWVHWPLPRSGEGSGTPGRAGRCGSCPEGAGQVQADARRNSIHRSRRGRRGAGGIQIADCRRMWSSCTKRSCETTRCSKKWTEWKPMIYSGTKWCQMSVTCGRTVRSACPCWDTGTCAKEQRVSCECSNCVHHSGKSSRSQTRDWAICCSSARLPLRPVLRRSSTHSTRRIQDSSGRLDEDWRYDPVGVRVNHPGDACFGQGSVHPRAGRWAAPRSEVAANGSKRWPACRKVRYRTWGLRTQFRGQHQRTRAITEVDNFHTPRSEFWKQEPQCLSMFQLARQVPAWPWRRRQLFQTGTSAQSITSCLKYKVKRSCRSKVPRSCVEFRWASSRRRKSRACESADQILVSSSTRLDGQMKRPASGMTADVEMASCVSETPSRSLAFSPEETTQTSAPERPVGRTRSREAIHRVPGVFKLRELHSLSLSLCLQWIIVPEGVQRWQAEDQCSVQPQHRESNQQVLRSRQYSQRESDAAVRCGRTLRIDQIVDTNRSKRGAGTHVYNPHLLDVRSTSSSVRKAGALVSPSSCLDGEPHGWVPVDTHNTPVPSSTGEAVGGLCSIRAQSSTGTRATRTLSYS